MNTALIETHSPDDADCVAELARMRESLAAGRARCEDAWKEAQNTALGIAFDETGNETNLRELTDDLPSNAVSAAKIESQPKTGHWSSLVGRK